MSPTKSDSHATRRSRRWLAPALALVATAGIGAALANPANAATTDSTVTVSYGASGSTYIGSIGTTVPIAPTTLVTTVGTGGSGPSAPILSGSLPIPSQVVTFNALGFIPIRATVTLVEATPITGSLTPTRKGDIVAAQVAYTIKLSNVSVETFGQWLPLYVGNNCQTINPANINITNASGQYLSLLGGGNLAGTYTIGNFQNCAPLNLPDVFGVGSLLVNSLVPGPNNTVALTLGAGTITGSTG